MLEYNITFFDHQDGEDTYVVQFHDVVPIRFTYLNINYGHKTLYVKSIFMFVSPEKIESIRFDMSDETYFYLENIGSFEDRSTKWHNPDEKKTLKKIFIPNIATFIDKFLSKALDKYSKTHCLKCHKPRSQ